MNTLYYEMNEFNPFRNKSLITSSVALESTRWEVSTILLFWQNQYATLTTADNVSYHWNDNIMICVGRAITSKTLSVIF